jgi:predicted metalloprotease with PDZ domain
MKRLICAHLVLLVVVATPVLAGDKGHCTAPADECLAKMYQKLSAKAWLGIEHQERDDGRWEVSKVVAQSPADKAGFRVGDIIVSLDGVECSKENAKAIKEAMHGKSPGSTGVYVVKRKGGVETFQVTYAHVPEELMAQWIGEHMIKHHLDGTKVAKK